MKGAIETMVSIILLTLMAGLGTSYVITALNTQRAQNYHTAVVSEIEASDFADPVIAACKEKAKKDGFNELKVIKNTNASTGRTYAEVNLDYNYSIPLLDVFLTHEIRGYAR